MNKDYPHNFIMNARDAKYPAVCSKCGLGIDKSTTPIVDTSGRITRELPPCKYDGLPYLEIK